MAGPVKRKAYRAYTIHVMKRVALSAKPMSAEPRHGYECKFTTRADVSMRGGAPEIAQINIGGKNVTHTFAINYTALPFDAQDRIKDARGTFYQILRVENVQMADRELRIHCAEVGYEKVEAAK